MGRRRTRKPKTLNHRKTGRWTWANTIWFAGTTTHGVSTARIAYTSVNKKTKNIYKSSFRSFFPRSRARARQTPTRPVRATWFLCVCACARFFTTRTCECGRLAAVRLLLFIIISPPPTRYATDEMLCNLPARHSNMCAYVCVYDVYIFVYPVHGVYEIIK